MLIGTSCTSTRMNKELLVHNTQMQQLAIKKMDPIEKLDILAAYTVEALENSLEYNKTKDVIKFIKLYSRQNKQPVERIYKEISHWYLNLNDAEKLLYGARLATKPYVRQLYTVIPKVEKKINKKLDKILFIGKFMKLAGLGLS